MHAKAYSHIHMHMELIHEYFCHFVGEFIYRHAW